MEHVSSSMIQAIRRDYLAGFTTKKIAEDRCVPVDTVREIVVDEPKNPRSLPTFEAATDCATARREIRAARRGAFGEPIALYVRAVKGNWCDLYEDWRADI